MVKYYLDTGDQLGSDMFSPYVWEGNGFGELINKISLNKEYGLDLKLLLVKYYIEGKFSGYMPIEPKPGNYSTKNKDIAVDVAVTKELFHNRNEFERREFIVDSTLNAVKLVQEKLKKLDVDFDSLLSDLKEVSKQYLEREGPYSKV